MTEPSVLVSHLDALPRLDFKELIKRRIEAVKEQKRSRSSTPIRELLAEGSGSGGGSLANERELLVDMVSKAQSLVKSLQSQLESEKADKDQKLRQVQRNYEQEVETLKKDLTERFNYGDRNVKEIRAVLIAEMKEKEAKSTEKEGKLNAEIQRLQLEVGTLKQQLATSQRELSTERLLKPHSLDHQLHIKKLNLQIADLSGRLEAQKQSKPVSETSSDAEFRVDLTNLRSEPASAKSIKAATNEKVEIEKEEYERKIKELKEEKRRLERDQERLLKLSSEKEAELTEEAERLRSLNSLFTDYTQNREDWVKAGFSSLAQALQSLPEVTNGSGLESALHTCSQAIQDIKTRLDVVKEVAEEEKLTKINVLHALDLIQKRRKKQQKDSGSGLKLDYPAELLDACAKLQKELTFTKQRQVNDQDTLIQELRKTTGSAADREADLMEKLKERTMEVKELREQLNDLLDQHLEDELGMTKLTNTRLLLDSEAGKKYIIVLTACVKALGSLISDISHGAETDQNGTMVLKMDIMRLTQENELLVARGKSDAEAFFKQISNLHEENSRFQNEIRLLKAKLDQYHQIYSQKMIEDRNTWMDQYELVLVANDQLRHTISESLQESLLKQTEKGEIEALKRLLKSKTAEIDALKSAETKENQGIMLVLGELKGILETPSHAIGKIEDVDKALTGLSESTASLNDLIQSQRQVLMENRGKLTSEIALFHKRLDNISDSTKNLTRVFGLKSGEDSSRFDEQKQSQDSMKEKEYFSQSLETLKTMHEAEIDSFRTDVLQMEEQFSSERKRAFECAGKLMDSMKYRQEVLDEMQHINSEIEKTDDPQSKEELRSRMCVLDDDIERHQQWELSLVENLNQILGPDPASNTIEEVDSANESSNSSPKPEKTEVGDSLRADSETWMAVSLPS